jgi:uncharacterized repeat protein (TIGR01451 family)
LCVFSNDVQNPRVTVPVEITVLDPVAPTASFTAPGAVLAGDPVDFTNTTTGTEPIDYTWNFGDGSATSSDPNPQHIFTAPGLYTVTLTAENMVDSSVFEKAILVAPKTDLSVSVTISPSPVTVGNQAALTALVSNAGPQTASEVVLSGAIPTGVEFISGAGCSVAANTLTCSLGTIASGANKSAVAVLKFMSTGSFDLELDVVGLEFDTDMTNNSGMFTIAVEEPSIRQVFMPIINRQP